MVPWTKTLRQLEWKWNIASDFNMNITFIYFNLKYSGEACLQERIAINSTGNITNGRYCGRRYKWSSFVSNAPITLEFYTVESSTSYFEFQYQLTHVNLTTFLIHHRSYSAFQDIENKSNVHPFSWVNKYIFRMAIYYNWNILVPKIFKLLLKFSKFLQQEDFLYFYDGPDCHSMQYDITTIKTFRPSSFQVSILYHGYLSAIEMNFKGYCNKKRRT